MGFAGLFILKEIANPVAQAEICEEQQADEAQC